jgi:hypothetical protein
MDGTQGGREGGGGWKILETENNFLIHSLAIGKESVGGNQGTYQGMFFFPLKFYYYY